MMSHLAMTVLKLGLFLFPHLDVMILFLSQLLRVTIYFFVCYDAPSSSGPNQSAETTSSRKSWFGARSSTTAAFTMKQTASVVGEKKLNSGAI